MHRSFRRSNKAVSTVFGMIFFLLIVVIVLASFMVVLNQSTALEGTMIQTREMDNERSAEQLYMLNSVYDPVGHACTTAFSNTGTISINLVRLWIEDLTSSAVQTVPISLTVTGGSTTSLKTYNIVLNAQSGDTLKFWVESDRGNQFTVAPNPGPPGPAGKDGSKWYYGDTNPPNTNTVNAVNGDYYLNTNTGDVFTMANGNWIWIFNIKGGSTYSAVAGGIGWIAMDFNTFEHWEFTQDYNGKSISSVNPLTTYTIASTNYVLFHIRLGNVDMYNDIKLKAISAVYILGQNTGGGSVKYVQWQLATVDPATHVLNAHPTDYTVTLPKMTSQIAGPTYVDIYFYGVYPAGNNAIMTQQLYPMNIILSGSRGTNQYGQNLPFVSLYFS